MRLFRDTANTDEIRDAALAGAHSATLPYSVFLSMIKHPLTDIGIQRFLADARRYASV